MVYLDDLVMFSKYLDDDIKYLNMVFKIFKEYGISLNNKKYVFGTT